MTDTTNAERRPAPGPAATIEGPITGGNGVSLLTGPGGAELTEAGYVEEEWFASGTARSYSAPDLAPDDGRIDATPVDDPAEYRTRIIVRRPADPSRFSGVVVTEWLNVSAGGDAAPDYRFLSSELLRQGHVWVGVSAQQVGVSGGVAVVSTGLETPSEGVVGADPARYGSLVHPGDRYSYDLFTQVGRALRASDELFGGIRPDHVLAVGESQSAFRLTTYIDAVEPLARVFDGYLVHSRGRGGAPLEDGTGIRRAVDGDPVTIRTDLDVPVLTFQTETELGPLFGYPEARQDDDDGFRLWEVAGTAHADATVVGSFESALGCPQPVNRGPQQYVLRAALRALVAWVVDGTLPARGPRLELTDGTIERDPDGIALGGIRTPTVDVPSAVNTGEFEEGAPLLCLLFGASTPFTVEELRARYESRDTYVRAFTTSLDDTIARGFVLPEDRDGYLGELADF